VQGHGVDDGQISRLQTVRGVADREGVRSVDAEGQLDLVMIMAGKGMDVACRYEIGITAEEQFLIQHDAPPFWFHYSRSKTAIQEKCEFLRIKKEKRLLIICKIEYIIYISQFGELL
jgi:hypothetical protein